MVLAGWNDPGEGHRRGGGFIELPFAPPSPVVEAAILVVAGADAVGHAPAAASAEGDIAAPAIASITEFEFAPLALDAWWRDASFEVLPTTEDTTQDPAPPTWLDPAPSDAPAPELFGAAFAELAA